MADNQAIIQVLYQVQGVDTLKAANAELDKSDKAGARVTDGTLKTTEALGLTRREWMRTSREASFYLTSAIGKTGEMGKAIGQATGMVTQLGESFMYGGGVGVGIALAGMAVSGLVSALSTATPQTEAFGKAIDDLAAGDQVARGLSQLSGATEDQAKQALEAAKQNSAFANELKGLKDAAEKARDPMAGLKDAITAYADERDRRLLNDPLWGKTAEDIKKTTEAELALRKATTEGAAAVLERTRLSDLWKKSIIGINDETASLNAELDKLSTSHTATLKSLTYDWTEAERKAGTDRTKIERDTADNITKINAQLSARVIDLQSNTVRQIRDIEFANTRRLSEDYYQYARGIESMNRDIAKSAAATAKDRLSTEADLIKSLARIDADQQDKATGIEEERQSALEEVRAKYGTLQLDQGRVYTEAELLTRKGFLDQQSQEEAAKITSDYDKQIAKLKKETAAQRAAAAQQKADRLAEIAEREKEQQEEQDYHRRLANETYAHSQQLAEQGMRDQIDKAQRTGEEQIAQARRTSQEQITAANETKQKQLEANAATLAETERGINHRRDTENAAYTSNVTAAKLASATKIQLLKDESTEADKLNKAYDNIKGTLDAGTLSAIRMSGALKGLPAGSYLGQGFSYLGYTPSVPSGGGSSGFGGFAAGGSFLVPGSGGGDRPYLIGLTPGERVSVTPANQTTNYGGITVNVYESSSARNTADEVVRALRSKGMAI